MSYKDLDSLRNSDRNRARDATRPSGTERDLNSTSNAGAKRKRTDEDREREYQAAIKERMHTTSGPVSATITPAAAAAATSAASAAAAALVGRGRIIDQRPAWLAAMDNQSPSVQPSINYDATHVEAIKDTESAKSISTASVNKVIDNEDFANEAGAEQDDEMMRLMGFSSFGSTSGRHVEDNDGVARGAVSKSKQRKYRQYMNRTGGFNRPLEKVP